ncbi:hypothetical protein [Streptomyces sp. NPDC005438]|uniref:hypothetical protein n=1 Tax=Streptomyces sp. NPDC005438 TaxID=3156880 RepID=UPI0033A7FB60
MNSPTMDGSSIGQARTDAAGEVTCEGGELPPPAPSPTPRKLDRGWLCQWRREILATLAPEAPQHHASLPAPGCQFSQPGEFEDGEEALPLPRSPAEPVIIRQLARHPLVAPDLITFYEAISEVSLPDVWNGYFVLPAAQVLQQLSTHGAVRTGERQLAVVFGNDGGGILFALAPDGRVYRSTTASRQHGFEPEPVAEDLTEFLERVREMVRRYSVGAVGPHPDPGGP